jgi:hypothetical protein
MSHTKTILFALIEVRETKKTKLKWCEEVGEKYPSDLGI